MSKDKIFCEHVSHIKKAHSENRLAIFVGAGFSKCTAKDIYPSWKDIIDGLKKDMGNNDENDFLKIAEYYKLEFGKDETKKKIVSFFPNKYKSSMLHKYLIELYPHYIITTNWDNIFEVTLEETSAVYDIIAEDGNLPTSTMDNKIIKIHGDFDHDNYVFTESDYLNYSFKFPLVEAYLKGILATHTILFMGYGYGDYDLKLIMTWIKNNSPIIRNRYMLVGKNQCDKIVEKYYSSHNVILLSLDMKSNHFDDFEYLNFLKLINDDDFKINTTSPQDYVYELLKPLDGLRYILFSHIQSCLTNCGLRITESGAMLYFYDKELSFDKNQLIRNKFKQFIHGINDYDDKRIIYSKIFNIMRKSSISGVADNKNYIFSDFLNNDTNDLQNFDRIISFDFNYTHDINNQNNIESMMLEVVCCYNTLQYEKALDICSRALAEILKTKELDYYFFALWNYNLILFELKYNTSLHDKYIDFEEKDIEEEYSRLPLHLRKKYKYNYEAVTQEHILSLFFKSQSSLEKASDLYNKIQNGGWSSRSDIPTDKYVHYNLLIFLLENNIIFDSYNDFKKICHNYVKLSFLRQKVNNKECIRFNIIEIYSIIKYFSDKDIKNLYVSFYDDIKNKNLKFILPDDDKEFIINVILKNCAYHYKTSGNVQVSSKFSKYICNIFEVIKFSDIGIESLMHIIDIINDALYVSKNMFDFFQSINTFFVVQYNLFYSNNDIFPSEKAITIIKTLLYKFLDGKFNVYEYEAIKSNRLKSIFDISIATKYKFDDVELVKKIVSKLNAFNSNVKQELSQSILVSLFLIGNDECKKIIKEYFLAEKEIICADTNFTSIEYNLFIAANNITRLTVEEIDRYFEFFKSFKDPNEFDSRILYVFNLFEYIKNSDNSLIDESLHEKFNKTFDLIKELIEQYKQIENKFTSFI